MFGGIGPLVIAGLILFVLYKMGSKLGKEKFDRTNSSGVEEFDSWGDATKAHAQEHLFKNILGPILAILLLIFILTFMFGRL